MNEAGYDDYTMDKRRKTDSQDVVMIEEVETDVYFKINFERFTIRWRNMVEHSTVMIHWFLFLLLYTICVF